MSSKHQHSLKYTVQLRSAKARDKDPAPEGDAAEAQPESAPVAQAPEDRYGAFARALNAKVPLIYNNAKAVQEMASLQLPCAARNDNFTLLNPHATAASVRWLATRQAMVHMVKEHPPAIISMYGAPRDQQIWGLVQNPPCPLHIYRPILVPDDIRRECVSVGNVVEGIYVGPEGAALFVDVYALGSQPLTPANLARFLGPRSAYFVLKRFDGNFNRFSTGAWIRSNGQIHARPDDSTQEWIAHDPVDWLHNGGFSSGIAWSVIATVADMDVIKVIRLDDAEMFNEQPLGVTTVRVPALTGVRSMLYQLLVGSLARSYYVTTLLWLVSFCACEELTVDKALYGQCCLWLQGRTRSNWNYRALYEHARDLIKDHTFILASWPREFNLALDTTVRAAWLSTLVTGYVSSSQVVVIGAPVAEVVNANLRNVDVPLRSNSFYWFIGALIVLFLCMMIPASTPPPLPLYNATPMSVLDVWWSPLMEEVLKMHWSGLLLVTGVDFYRHWSVATVVFHQVTYRLPFPVRLIVHYCYNYHIQYGPSWHVVLERMIPSNIVQSIRSLVNKIIGFDPWSSFKAQAYELSWEQRLFYPEEVRSTPFAPRDWVVPRQLFAHTPTKPICPDLVVVGNLPSGDMCPEDPYFCYWPVDVPSFVPARTWDMWTAGVLARILAPPPLPPEIQLMNWQAAPFSWFQAMFPQLPVISFEEAYAAWLSHFPNNKRKLMIHAKDDIDRDGFNASKMTVQLFVKADEILLRPSLNFKPRMVANIDPRVQVLTGPYIREATKRLHEIWGLDTYTSVRLWVHGIFTPIHITFGSGLLDRQLDKWLENTILFPDSVWIIVAGDDSVMALHHEYWCADASSFDQSQSKGPLEFEYRFIARLGVPTDAIDILRKVSYAPYRHDRDENDPTRFRIYRNKRPMRDTGGADTTLGNSIVMASAWVYAVTSNSSYEDAFAYLGFKMKMRVTDVEGVNFLKGSWPIAIVDGNVTRAWLPLPSRFLKFGKSLRNPCQIYRIHDRETAVRVHANSLAACYEVASAVPLIRVFVQRFRDSSLPTVSFELSNDYHLYSVQFSLLPPCEDPHHPLIQYYGHYYGVDPGDFLKVEEMLKSAPLFSFLEAPLFSIMARVDYE